VGRQAGGQLVGSSTVRRKPRQLVAIAFHPPAY
jgi:hypothetical protein